MLGFLRKKQKLKSLVPSNFSLWTQFLFQTRPKEGRVNGNDTQIKFRHIQRKKESPSSVNSSEIYA